MPLTMIGPGMRAKVRRVGGGEDVRRYLGNLGFVSGSEIEMISIC